MSEELFSYQPFWSEMDSGVSEPTEPYQNVVVQKSFDFAISTIRLYQFLSSEKREYVLSKQILRSGTAVGALIREAQIAESKPDFIHKLGIAKKECDETIYWLELLSATEIIGLTQFQDFSFKAKEILKILRSIIITSKKNLKLSKATHNS